MKNLPLKKAKWTIAVLSFIMTTLLPGVVMAQVFISVNGNTQVEPSSTHTYVASVSNTLLQVSWNITNGVIVSGGFPGNTVTVRWNSTGSSGTVAASVTGASTSRAIQILQPLRIGNITPRMNVNFNTSPGNLPVAGATGGPSTTYTYQWQRSADNVNWADVGNTATNPGNLIYNPGNLTTGAYFRIRVTSGGWSSFSNSLLVNVLAAQDGGTITYSQTIAPGTRPVILKGTSARGIQNNSILGTAQYQWQQSTDGINWQNIPGATQRDYWPPVLTATTHYRRNATASSMAAGTSNTATITVSNPTGGSTPAVTAHTALEQPLVSLQDIPHVTASHYNRVVSFTTKRPGITLPASLLSIARADGTVGAQYSDGAGRTVQSIVQQATPAGFDIINAVQYDDFGRSEEAFAAYTDGLANAGAFRNNAGTQQRSFYNSRFPGDPYLYSRTVSEDGPEGKILAAAAPGRAFAGSNTGGRSESRIYYESEEVIYWYLNASGLPTANGVPGQRFYGNKDLAIEESIDMNGRRLLRYSDGMGRMILEKVQNLETITNNSTGWNLTYYVYDEMGRLRFAIPSVAAKAALNQFTGVTTGTVTISSTILNNLCFEFRYDEKGRVIWKKVPEIAHELFVYDALGRQVLSQDARQRLTNQWSVIKFDGKDRPTVTGIWNAGALTEASIRTQAAGSSDYPALAAITEIHTETFYDDYSFTGAAAKPFNTSLFTNIATGTNAVAPAQSLLLNDLPTGTRVRVFYPAGITGTTWLTTVNYYDNRERLIQTHSDNILGGVDVLSTRYDFTGKPLGQLYRHQNPRPNANYAVLDIFKRSTYDPDGRPLQVFQRVNTEPERHLLTFEYNELGQLSRKILGPGAGAAGANLESLHYTYNLQGQLTGINAGYARDRTQNHWWGASLHYHDGYTRARNDGTMSGMQWRSRGRFDEAFSYGFEYDAMSRLQRAFFTTNTAVNTTGGSWTQAQDFTTDNLAYDENGNILSMRSNSTAFGTTRTVDNLTYTYNANSNLLRRVSDAGSGAPASANAPGFIDGAPGLRDFKDGTNGGDDYTYDANGNITSDLNKQFTATYNLLDKPERIIIQNNSMRDIRYVYDATGERLQKIVRHNDTVRTTTYIDGLTYHNDTTLLYFVNDAGRTRRNHRGRLVNDYYIDDHLGNVRMVLTDERDTTAYLAAFETTRDAAELATWRNRNTTRETIINTNLFFNNPNPNAQFSRLNGSDAARRQGPSIVLKVMAGDTLNVHTRALYNTPHSTIPNTSPLVNDIVHAAISAFLGTTTGTLDGKSWLQTGNNAVLNTQDLASFVTSNQAANNSPNSGPRAYLKYLLFDENFKLVQGLAERIDNGPDAVHTYTLPQMVAQKNGFVYIYTSNESPVNVFFDDITVVHRTGPLLQESAFYPFGMEITPLSSYAAIKTPNQKDYQRNELDEEFGLELHYFDARMYDAQVGRFNGVDVYADQFTKLSPYNYAGNNPYYFADPDGRFFFAIFAKIVIKAISNAVIKKVAVKAAKKAAVSALKGGSGLMKSGITGAMKGLKTAKALGTAQKIGSIAGGVSNTVRNWDKIMKGGNFNLFRAANHFLAGSAGGEIAALGTPLASFAGMGLGGMLNVEADYLFDKEVDFWKSFSRGASSAIAGKGMGKSFLKGAGVKMGPAKWVGVISGGTEKGLQTVFNNYDLYGRDGIKKFGAGFYWQSFAAGALAGGLKESISWGFDEISDKVNSNKVDLSIFSVGLNSIGSDITKKIALKSMNYDYKLYLKTNKSDNSLSFFNGFAQMIIYQIGK